MSDILGGSIEEFSGRRLEKLEKIRHIFLWPMVLGFGIILLDFLIYVLGFGSIEPLERITKTAAFFAFPAILIYIVMATFYSSYRVLGSRGHKNILVFFLFQIMAYYLMVELDLEIPAMGSVQATLASASIALGIVLAVTLVQRSISVPDDLPTSEEGIITFTDKRNESTGLVIAALFSLVIAAMIYFRNQGGIPFVSYGVLFGVVASGVVLKADKLILCLLFFLDPRGAINLFHLIKVRERVQQQKERSELEVEVGVWHKEERKTKALRLANELDQELSRAGFNKGERYLRSLIDSLQSPGGMSPEEQERKTLEAQEMIARLRSERTIPKVLPEVDYSTLSLGEKIAGFLGLTKDNIREAIAEGLIDETQSHLWTPEAQFRIGNAMNDFKENRIRGRAPVYIAESWVEFFNRNAYLLDRIVESLTSDSPASLRDLLGANGLVEMRFATVAREYSAVIQEGPAGMFNVLGAFEVPR